MGHFRPQGDISYDFPAFGKIWSKGGRNPYVWATKMKYFFPMLCVVAAGGAGYMFEPQITPNLISYNQTKERVIEVVEKSDPAPAPALPKVDPVPPPVEPPPVVQNDPEPTPEPPPVVQADPEKMDEATPPVAPPDAPPESAAMSPEEIEKVMQESIKTAQVKEFTFEQVLGWKAGEPEEVDGVSYQTGQAAYKAETIFGVKTIQAKALIKDGKVTKWIWPNSGMEIK